MESNSVCNHMCCSSGLIWFWTGSIFLNQYNFSCTGTSCLKLVQSDILKGILFWGVINKTGAWFFRWVLEEQNISNNLLTSHSPTHPPTATFYLPLLFFFYIFLLFFFLLYFLFVITILYLNTFFLFLFNLEHTKIWTTDFWISLDL